MPSYLSEEEEEFLSDDNPQLAFVKQDEIEFSTPDLSNDILQEIQNDFQLNIISVTLPACFTNTIWRLMNLNGIPASNEPIQVIAVTGFAVAPVVFIACFVVDFIRRCVRARVNNNIPLPNQHHNNINNIQLSVLLSLSLAIKFYFVKPDIT